MTQLHIFLSLLIFDLMLQNFFSKYKEYFSGFFFQFYFDEV